VSLQDANDADLVKYYVDLRDFLKADEVATSARLAPHKENMNLVEAELQRRLIERGSDSTKTEYGTAYQTEVMSVRTADKGVFVDWAIHQGVVAEMDLRPAKETVKTFMDENNGQTPPGIDVTFIRKINIRRS
jgi:replicative DNA helicase